jgi:hypothetical protein
MKSFIIKLAAVVITAAFATSCMTTYDAYGRPVQSVDPAVAATGVVAAGVLGYALANDNDHRHHHRGHYHRPRRGHWHY